MEKKVFELFKKLATMPEEHRQKIIAEMKQEKQQPASNPYDKAVYGGNNVKP